MILSVCLCLNASVVSKKFYGVLWIPLSMTVSDDFI